MRLYQICSNEFILVRSDQTFKVAKESIQRLKPSSIIVRRWDQGEAYYYLYNVSEFLQLIDNITDDLTIEGSKDLNLLERSVTPSLDAYQAAEELPLECVVIDKERVIGFINTTTFTPYRHISSFSRSFPSSEIILRDREGWRGRGEGTGGHHGHPSNGQGGPGGGGTREELSTKPVSRSIQASFYEKVALGKIYLLLVKLTKQLLPQIDEIPISISSGTLIEIRIQPVRGFSLVGSEKGHLLVTSEEETLTLQFELLANEIGPGEICIFASFSGQPLGSITLAPVIVAESQVTSTTSYIDNIHVSRSIIEAIASAPPDLILLIDEEMHNEHGVIKYYLTAPRYNLNANLFQIDIERESFKCFHKFFEDIDRMETLRVQPEVIEEKLNRRGVLLFNELVPEDLRKILWDLQDKISTVLVLSEEPWIPWELIKLEGKKDDEVVEGQFFCEAFEMTRWFPKIYLKHKLSLENLALIAPSCPNEAIQDECKYLLSIAGDQRKVTPIPAKLSDVLGSLDAGVYDAWHFTGHGLHSEDDPFGLILELDDDVTIAPTEIAGKAIEGVGKTRPLVFLNGCQTGMTVLSLTGISGWAKTFIDAGAAGFIGSFWSIREEVACKFVKEFYGNLLSGDPVGTAVKKARESLKALGGPTRLAYTVFASPSATMQKKE